MCLCNELDILIYNPVPCECNDVLKYDAYNSVLGRYVRSRICDCNELT